MTMSECQSSPLPGPDKSIFDPSVDQLAELFRNHREDYRDRLGADAVQAARVSDLRQVRR
jgi:hypothetical protein